MDMALAMMVPAFSWFFYILLPLAPLVYLILRWRAYREETPADPQLGVKTVLYYFRTLGYHVILVGEFLLLYGLMDEGSRWQLLRLSAAMLLSGGLIYGLHVWFLVKRTNTAAQPYVARLYNGFNMLICGLVGTGALVATLSTALSEELPWEALKISAGLFVVYGSAWFAQTSLMIRRSVTQPNT